MNWLKIPFFDFQSFKKQQDILICKKAYLLETDFWNKDLKEHKTGNLYAYKMSIRIEDENTCHYYAKYDFKNCYYLKSTNCRYVVLDEPISNCIKEHVKGSKSGKGFLTFKFSYTGDPVKTRQQYESYKGIKQDLITYKLPEKLSENSNGISFKSDGGEVRMVHIKTIFESFIWTGLLKYNKYVTIIYEKRPKELFEKIIKDDMFDLYYFKNHFECYESLKVFVESLRYFKLMKDDEFKLKTSENSDNTFFINNTMTVSLLMDLLNEKFTEDQSMNENSWKNKLWSFISKGFKLYQNNLHIPKEKRDFKTPELLFGYCCNYLKDQMLNDNVLLLISGKYDIDFYFDKLYELIYISVKSNIDFYEFSNAEDKKYIIFDMLKSFDNGLLKLQTKAARDLCESIYLNKYFSQLLGREIKTLNDYIHVENMICDYHNMFVYIANLACTLNGYSCDLFGYLQPIFVDNYNNSIIDGIEIKFENQREFGEIKAFDENGKEIKFEKNSEYFIDKLERFYCTFGILKNKSIYEIEVNSLKNDFNGKIKIDTYLGN